MTSFDVVKFVRNRIPCKKVGHGGTLDPLAEGVLLVLTGRATKEFDRIMTYKKSYEGIIRLGQFTETDDAEGEVTETLPVPELNETDIESILKEFIGQIQQIPPAYSALKIGGKPSYKLARQGKPVPAIPRMVDIYQSELLNWDFPDMKIRVQCGRGTYIRAIARDLGMKLNTGGYLKSLIRTEIGPYSVEDSIQIETFQKKIQDENLSIA